jgi:hypothetical protein
MITLTQMIVQTGAASGATWNKKLFQKVARVATGEELVVTMIDGVEETRNVAQSGDYVLTGPKGEQYVLGKAKFEKLYRHIEGNVYETLPDAVQAVEVTQPLNFEAPWGGEMIAEVGDYIVYRSATDSYRVEREIFLDTYAIA